MTPKRIILARPNSFIINDMKHLLSDGYYIPTPIDHLSKLNQYSVSEISGVVISTAINSTIEEGYDMTVKEVINKYKTVPILLASLISLDKIRKTIKLKFDKIGLDFDLLSIEDAMKKSSIDPSKEIIVIEKQDIAYEYAFPKTLSIIKRYFK